MTTRCISHTHHIIINNNNFLMLVVEYMCGIYCSFSSSSSFLLLLSSFLYHHSCFGNSRRLACILSNRVAQILNIFNHIRKYIIKDYKTCHHFLKLALSTIYLGLALSVSQKTYTNLALWTRRSLWRLLWAYC